ncbi:MAG: Esterase [Actinomycetia bacterium]|nr:Esterase [Actinomycetes bacterium]
MRRSSSVGGGAMGGTTVHQSARREDCRRSLRARFVVSLVALAALVTLAVGVVTPTAAGADDGDAVFADGVTVTAQASYSCSSRTVNVLPTTNEILSGSFGVYAKAYVYDFNYGGWIESGWFNADGITTMVFSGITAPYRYAYITYAHVINNQWVEPSDWVYIKDDLDNSNTFCNANGWSARAAGTPAARASVTRSLKPPVTAIQQQGVAGQTNVAFAAHLEPTPSDNGYWITDAFGRVTTYGDARNHGSWGALERGEAVTGLSSMSRFDIRHPSEGYWLFSNKGRVKGFAQARFYGDLHSVALNGPILGSIPTRSGHGYYMVASDGGIFAFGDARFYGSMGGRHLNAPVRALVPTKSGRGYWLVASDGGIFAFGDAAFRGSMGATHLNRPIVGMVRYGNGYLMVGSDGGIFNFSNKAFFGSLGNRPPATPIVSVASTEGTPGYWMLGGAGTVYGFGGSHVFRPGQAHSQPHAPLLPTPPF